MKTHSLKITIYSPTFSSPPAMKNPSRGRKKPAFPNRHHLPGMFQEGGSDVGFKGINLEGRNSGASMIARHGGSLGGLQDYCSVNIYISNNVQGVNNSVVMGSEVKQGDPGIHLVLKGLRLDKGFRKTHKKKITELLGGFGWVALFAAIAMFLFSMM